MPSTIDEPLDLAHFIAEEDLQAEIVAPGAQMPTVNAAAATGYQVRPRPYGGSALRLAKPEVVLISNIQ